MTNQVKVEELPKEPKAEAKPEVSKVEKSSNHSPGNYMGEYVKTYL